MAILKRALIVLLVLLLIPVALIGGLFLYAKTDSGLATIAGLVNTYASSDDSKIRIGRLEGSFPSDLTIRDLEIADREGRWLSVDRARVAWSPLALIGRSLTIDAVELGRVDVARAPIIPPSTEPEPPADPDAPLIPELPIQIELKRFALDDLNLAEAVMGVPARLAAEASASLRDPAQGLAARFDVRRTDGVAGQIKGEAGYTPSTKRIRISIRGGEPAGGLVARLAQIPGLPPVDIGVEGGGTLDALRAQAVLTAGDRGRIDAAVDLGRKDSERTVVLSVEGDVGRLVPPAYADLLGGGTRIAAEAVVPDAGPIRLTDVTVSGAALRLGLRGAVDIEAETLDVVYDLKAGEIARFASLLPPGLGWGSLALSGTAKGPFTHPIIVANLQGAGVNAPQAGADAARIDLTLTPNGPLTEPGARVAAVATVKADGLRFADERLMAGVGRTLTLDLDVDSTLAGDAEVKRADLALAGSTASYTGAVSAEAARGRATVAARDLSMFSTLAGRTLAGAVDLAADVDLAYDMSRLDMALDGRTTGLSTGLAQVDGLTGGDVTIRGGVRRSPNGAFAFDDVKIDGRHVTLAANGSATPEAANVTVKAELADLERLDARAKGRALLDAALTGKLDDLALKATLSVPDGRALDRALKDVRVTVDATDVTGAVGGVIGLAGSLDGKPIRGTGRLTTEANGVRRVEGLDLAIASTTVKGDVAATPDGLATGRIVIAAPDLAELGALALTELGGRLDADVALSVENGVQRAAVKANGADILAPGARVKALDVAATVTDPTGKILIDGTVSGSGVAAGGQIIETLSVKANGQPDRMDVTADVAALGSALSTAARVLYAPTATVVDVSRLDLKGGGQNASLAAPARVRVVGSDVFIDALSLKAGQGGALNVTGSAGERLALDVAIKELPLALANAFAPTLGLSGMLDANAKVTGSASAPVATFDVRARDLSVADTRAAKIAALQIATSGRYEGARVVTDTVITGPERLRVTAQGAAPLGEGDLDMVVAIRELPLSLVNGFWPGLGLAGLMNGDARIVGPIAAPRGDYAAKIDDFTSATARGVPAVQIETKGKLEGLRVTTDTLITGGGGVRATVKGSAPLASGDVDLDVAIAELPLSLANAFVPSLGLAGSLTGTADVTGPITAPRGAYDLKVVGLKAAQAPGPFEVTAKGALEGPRVTTDALVTGPDGMRVTAVGSAPLAAGDLDLTVAVRELPLSLGNGVSPGLGLAGRANADARIGGPLAAPRATYSAKVRDFTSSKARGVPAISVDTSGAYEGNRVTTDTLILGGGGVRATIKGSAPIGDGELDMDVAVAELPLAIANAFQPSLGLAGRLQGGAKVTGPVSAPRGGYDFKITGLTAAQARGVPTLQVTTKGELEGQRVTTNTLVTGGAMRLSAVGSAPLGVTGELDMNVELRQVPLALANGFSPDLGAQGVLQGDAKVAGPLSAPRGSYTLKVSNLSTAQTRGAGVPAAQIDARGDLGNGRVTTNTVVTGAGGLRVTATGSAPLGQGDLDLKVAGRAPLAFLNDTLSVSGDRVDGAATFDVAVRGSTSSPAINGTAQLANASYSNRASGLQLRGIQASVAANGTNVELRSLRATTRNGGSISGSGRVAVDPARGFPGELSIRAQNAEVMGTDIVTAIVDTNLSLSGALARRPTVSGTISARSIEIQIPDRLPAQYTPLDGVQHRNAQGRVAQQLRAANAAKTRAAAKEDAFVATLDIDVQANNRIFIRGMGMTAEAGGQIKLAGTSAAPQPVGAFELRSGRGQIVVIGQRLTFTRGSVSFAGDLDPTIDFLAETKARDVTAQVVVTGTASRPQINFTSQPTLPTDEVLARLLFKKSAGELNASEALQLAQGLAQYTAGGGGSGALESVRKSLGVDVLDVTAGDGDGGGPAVGVGRYISDNIYLGVRQGTTPESSKVTVDIDVTKNIKVQGETGAAGNSAAGVAVEWDY
ncbi:translocation/assembly module TamB domain-containing protein [Methylopila turkensis]|uniref:Translocation/assembly module TamB n=1 Tax=Methylopila turkensis TaxID=1437816 RepID=A0A9W6JS59_9HYPH|nr:translocation/assembly module TamB domain-containing protein [Methylopila turkensis]GLK81065.1 translocation/assembly module TamB [Methylopila turkensis]